MKKLQPILFRPRPDQAEKLQRLAESTGGNLSEALRQVLDCVEFEEVTITRPAIRFTNPTVQGVTNG